MAKLMSVSDAFDVFGDKTLAAVQELSRKMDQIMANQDDLDARSTTIEAEQARILALVTDLHGAAQPLDFTRIDAAIAALQAVQ